MNYQGVIIEESLNKKDVLGRLKIISTKFEPVVARHKTPWLKQWTLHTVEVPEEEAENIAKEISQSLETEHPWYADFKNETTHFVIFSNKIFRIGRTSQEQYDRAKEYGISLGIPPYQVDFQPAKHLIIFSHGFGVRKDDLGLLTDIAAALPEAESILFDYYEVNDTDKTITMRPFSVTTVMLNQVIAKARSANPGAIIDLVCHSQGTVIAALARPAGVRKTILISPPFDMDVERTLSRHNSNPKAVIDLEGISKLSPLDGFTRLVPAQYWRERRKIYPINDYNVLAKETELIAIIANQDEILPKTDLKDLDPKIKQIFLDGDHNFNDAARKELISLIRDIILT